MATTSSQSNLHGSNKNLFDIDGKKKLAAQQNLAEKRRASLDTRHKYFLEKFAQLIDEKPAVLENSFILGNKVDIVNEFFAENGSKKVLFYWQSASKVRHLRLYSSFYRKKLKCSVIKPKIPLL
jgi:dynein heavy chain